MNRCRSSAAVFAVALALVGVPCGDLAAAPDPPTHGSLVHVEHDPIQLFVPQEYATIQAAIDASRPNDTIYIASGVYNESLLIRNRGGLELRGASAKTTIIRSTGTVLRVEGTPRMHVEGIRFESSADIAIETNGSGVDFWFNVIVADAPSGRATLRLQCARNSELVRNTFVRPAGATGPFLELNPDTCAGAGSVSVRRNLFWTWGKPVADYASRAVIHQNNLGVVDAEPYPEENLFEFPLFCSPSARDYNLGPHSPCLPENNPWGRTIGALGLGCGPVGVEPATWGQIKNSYR